MRQSSFLPVLVYTATTLCFACTASADVIFGTLNPDFATGAFPSDYDPVQLGSQQAANQFVLQDGLNVITDIHWWGVYAGILTDRIADDDFTVRIFADNGFGAPQRFAFVLRLDPDALPRVDTGLNLGSSDIYVYELDIAPLTLTAGVTYYLSIVNNTAGDDDTWSWMQTNGLASLDPWWSRFQDGQFWTLQNSSTPTNPAFALTNDGLTTVIPEPSTLLLVLFGVVTGFRKRRTRQQVC